MTAVVGAAVLAAGAAAGLVLSHRSGPTAGAAGPAGTAGTALAQPGTERPPSHPGARLARLYRRDAGGVVRVEATTCGGSGSGSGFLVSPTLVATDAHVVDGAVAVGLTSAGTTLSGQVVGIDDAADVALIRVGRVLGGHVFRLARVPPAVGTEVGVIGYPGSGATSLSRATIDGAGRTVEVAGRSRRGLLQTDAPLDPAESGGPLLAAGGTVVGLAASADRGASGRGYAVPAATAARLVRRWVAAPSPPPAGSCPHPLGPGGAGVVHSAASGPDAAGISATLASYFDAIDRGDYAGAYDHLGPQARAGLGEPQMAAEDASSYDYDVRLEALTPQGPGAELADVSFTSLQRATLGPSGEACDTWTLQYAMVRSSGTWLIDAATGRNGVAATACPS